jgi:hypothetical protein
MACGIAMSKHVHTRKRGELFSVELLVEGWLELSMKDDSPGYACFESLDFMV